jgi:type I restriction enzyme M protein
MIDAAHGYMKDGPKNRLRERDIHRIVDTFTTLDDTDPRYARMVGLAEIEKNDFNLNLPRYIDSSTPEDPQDIDGHLKGGIPAADVQALHRYWAVCPALQATLFKPRRPGYLDLTPTPSAVKGVIHEHAEFQAFTQAMKGHFDAWRGPVAQRLKTLVPGFQPKALIHELAEGLLAHYEHQPTAGKLIDPYAVYQHLMDYWAETMQDDAYLITEDSWQATPYRVLETKKNKDGSPGKTVDKGWACDLVPKALLVQHHFAGPAECRAGKHAGRDDRSGRGAQRGRCGVRRLRQDKRQGSEDPHQGDRGRCGCGRRTGSAEAVARLVRASWPAEAAHQVAGF